MLPEELYKRKHFGTPESVILIVVNYVIMSVAIEVFAMCAKVSWFFWVIVAGLAVYNYFNIKRNAHEYGRNNKIGYAVSLAGIVLMFFLFRMRAGNC